MCDGGGDEFVLIGPSKVYAFEFDRDIMNGFLSVIP